MAVILVHNLITLSSHALSDTPNDDLVILCRQVHDSGRDEQE